MVTTSILGNWLNLSYRGACVLFQFGGKICYPMVNWQYLSRVGVLILHTVGILSQILLCRGRMSWCCRMLNSIPGLCSLDGEIAPLPQLWDPECLQMLPDVPCGQNCPRWDYWFRMYMRAVLKAHLFFLSIMIFNLYCI